MAADLPPHVEAFVDLVAPLVGAGRAEHGTIMGGPCLRSDDEFVAMPLDRASRMGGPGGLVVKLTAERVTALVASGEGAPFAPAGRTFREWVQVTHDDHDRWLALVEEAVALREEDRRG